jgi:hypothetical protein
MLSLVTAGSCPIPLALIHAPVIAVLVTAIHVFAAEKDMGDRNSTATQQRCFH